MASLVRNEGLKAGIRLPFARGGAHTKEVKSYNVSVYGMYKGLTNCLNPYPELETIDESSYSSVCWVIGRLYVGHHRRTRVSNGSEEVLEDAYAFDIKMPNSQDIVLVTKDEYFSSGYENLLNMMSPVSMFVEAQVNCSTFWDIS